MTGHPFPPAIAAELDALFAPWNRADAPGLVVGIRRRGHGLYRRAFGMASLESATANHVATRMRIGSTTKHFLALLVLQLEERGLVALDDPIGAHLPELTGANAVPTIRQLLQHRGGTRCHIDLGFIGHGLLAAPPGSALAALVAQTGRNFAPGTATIYNNGGYHLVSQAVARVTGKPLAALLAEHFFDPLGMHDTMLAPSDHVMIPGAASLHLPPVDGAWRRGLFPSHEILGEGGILSTVGDMLIWTAYLQSAGAAGRLLDIPADPDGFPGYYGLGLMARRHRGVDSFRHAGGVVGGASEMLCVPGAGLDIVILSNGAPNASPGALADKVVDIVLADELGPAPERPAPSTLAPWLGDYASDDSGMVYSIEDLDGRLFLRVAKYPVPALLETADDGWLATGLTGLGPIRIRPEGQDGRAIRLIFAGREEVLAKLDTPAPDVAAITGRYHSAESGLSAIVEQTDDGFALSTIDRWGTATFALLPIGGDWLHMRSTPDPAQFGATLRLGDSWSGGFTLNSARTRNLTFQRMD